MKSYLADDLTSDEFYVAFTTDAESFAILRATQKGLFGWTLTGTSDVLETLSDVQQVELAEDIAHLLSRVETADISIADIDFQTGSFELPEWLLLDDYTESDIDIVYNSKTTAVYRFELLDGKVLLSHTATTPDDLQFAREFWQRGG